MLSYRIVHYINQFFAGIGGEEKADYKPEAREGVVGPGQALNAAFKGRAQIVGTVICGDSYFAEHMAEASAEILEMIRKFSPDAVVAGPAFNAGRYGTASGAVLELVSKELKIPVVGGMYPENPGVELYRKSAYIVRTSDSARGMGEAVQGMARIALKLLDGEKIGTPEEEGYIERGLRKNIFLDKVGGERAAEMLAKKLRGEPFKTEYPMPVFDRVAPNPPIHDMKKAVVALVTSGGIVPKGNPDHIEASSATHYGEYSLAGVLTADEEHYETAHGGYDPTYANKDPNRVLPVDVLRQLEKEGVIGKLHEKYYSTVGNGTSVGNAKRFGEEIVGKLKKDGVDAVIVTSTWGTCTRCGATLVKEIERGGIPVVHVCTIVPISQTVGANRIVPAVAIPHPLGDPTRTHEEEVQIRRNLVLKALKALGTEVHEQTVFTD